MKPELNSGACSTAGRRLFIVALTAGTLFGGCVGAKPSQTAPDPAQAASPALMQEYAQALLLNIKGDYWGAIEGLRTLMAELPEESAIPFSLSQSYRHLAVLDSARVYGEAAVKLEPENSHYLRYLATLEHEARQHERSAELYGKAFELERDKPELLYLQGLELLSASQSERAIEVLEKAVTLDPYNEDALLKILNLQIGLKRYVEAIETCGKLLQIESGNVKIRLLRGELYAKNGQEALALDSLKGVVQSSPAYGPGWRALFNFSIQRGRSEDFHRDLSTFLDSGTLSSEEIDEFVRLFIIRSDKQKQYERPTRELLDELIARHPHQSRLFVLKGVFEMLHDRQREGQRCFRRAIELDGGNAEARESLITSHITMNEQRQAYLALRQARSALPAERLRWKLLEGALLVHAGAQDRALTVLEQAVGMKTNDGDMPLLIGAYTSLALVYDELGMKKRSRQAYATVLRLDAHNALAMNNLAYLFAEEGIQLQKALLLATNAVLLDPENPVYLDTLGWVNFKLGNFDRARILLEKAIETGIEEAEVYLHLGEVYRKLGQEPKAKEMLEKAKSTQKEHKKKGGQ